MSNSGKYVQKNKIYGIAKIKTDIIFLSDVRISNKNKVSGFQEICKTFLLNSYCQYIFLHNSSANKRGTGILIKQGLPFTELRRVADPAENYLLLLADIKGKNIIIGSIYGPNDHDVQFFRNLKRDILALGDYPVIIGGDWNCTGSTDHADLNIDCLNMAAPPNLRHSRYLSDMCSEVNLIDPFRGLHPNRQEFTFVPRSEAMNNRSRIDFFLISRGSLANVTNCEILHGLQSRLFDHKAVILDFNKNVGSASKGSSISTKILGHLETELLVRTAVAECYIQHIESDLVVGFNKNLLLENIGTIRALLRDLGTPFKHSEPFFFDADESAGRALLATRIQNILNNIDVAALQALPLGCSIDIFTETLLFSIKNDVCSFQHFISVKKKERRKAIIADINREKNINPPNIDVLKNLEKLLLEIDENELKLEVEKSPLYEFINTEKITPEFLKLSRSAKIEAKLSDIKKPDGSDFVNDEERNEFIVSFFANIYKKPEGEENIGEHTIENFLGPNTVTHPIVQNSKLTEGEALSLEGEITLLELDNAINECRIRSAAGPDGINNAFIKKFWYLLRDPIQKYANYSFELGQFSQTFCNGSIKLIPKKGDTTQIKNWRPISLLNCIYKVISRVINNRLKKVSDRILSRAQKGFTSSRFIQEVLINVIETIARTNAEDKSGLVIAIDFAKAFDSLSHRFM